MFHKINDLGPVAKLTWWSDQPKMPGNLGSPGGTSMSFTESLQRDRHIVVSVDPARSTVRVKSAADACTDVSCSEQTLVVTDDGTRADLAQLNAGDIVRLEGAGARPERIVVLRRVWDELSSPEW
jgi:hypothetical protein